MGIGQVMARKAGRAGQGKGRAEHSEGSVGGNEGRAEAKGRAEGRAWR